MYSTNYVMNFKEIIQENITIIINHLLYKRFSHLLKSNTTSTWTHDAGFVKGKWVSGSTPNVNESSRIRKNTLMALLALSTCIKN